MFGFIMKIFIWLLTGVVNASNYAKYVCLGNKKCEVQPTIINFHPNENAQGLLYDPFAINLVRSIRRFNTLNDLSNKASVQNK